MVKKPAPNGATRNHFPATWAQDGHGAMTSPQKLQLKSFAKKNGRYKTCLHHWHQKFVLASKPWSMVELLDPLRSKFDPCEITTVRSRSVGRKNKGRSRRRETGVIKWDETWCKSYGSFEGFPLCLCIVWLGNTPEKHRCWAILGIDWFEGCKSTWGVTKGLTDRIAVDIAEYSVPQDYMQIFGDVLQLREKTQKKTRKPKVVFATGWNDAIETTPLGNAFDDPLESPFKHFWFLI